MEWEPAYALGLGPLHYKFGKFQVRHEGHQVRHEGHQVRHEGHHSRSCAPLVS